MKKVLCKCVFVCVPIRYKCICRCIERVLEGHVQNAYILYCCFLGWALKSIQNLCLVGCVESQLSQHRLLNRSFFIHCLEKRLYDDLSSRVYMDLLSGSFFLDITYFQVYWVQDLFGQLERQDWSPWEAQKLERFQPRRGIWAKKEGTRRKEG